MSEPQYNDDNIRELLRQKNPRLPEVYPRTWAYNPDPEAEVYAGTGAQPYDASPDELIDERDWKEAIEHAHNEKIFPQYHKESSWNPGKTWDQDGLGYCWTWGITGCMMSLRELEGKPTKQLSPVSLGWTVNWQNRGNYLMSAIRGMRERGVCEMSYTPNQHSTNHRQYKDGWEENALLYRLDEYWDLDNRSEAAMVKHLVTALCCGKPVYIAHNWWGHALQIESLRWNERVKYNMEFGHMNSHKDGLIWLSGAKGTPDEAYALGSSLTITG